VIVYILRHAIALDRSDWKGADSERPLAKEGIQKMKKVAAGMRALEVEFDWILTSPYRRAYDTATIVADAYKARKKLKISRSLASDGDPKTLVRHLALDFRAWESVLLVGHEPYLTRLVGVLISGNPDIHLTLKKAGLLRLSASSLTYGPCATLEWSLPPKLIRRLSHV
jgi:phosphohistidine phosphatase